MDATKRGRGGVDTKGFINEAYDCRMVADVTRRDTTSSQKDRNRLDSATLEDRGAIEGCGII